MTVPEKPVWESRRVARKSIIAEPAFRSRLGRLDVAHVKTLVAAIRRGSKLSPVTLWREEGRDCLVLLDGEHRLAAWASAGLRGAVPARVVICSRRDALLIAAGANTKDALPLTQRERTDLAWRLVREPDTGFSKRDIAKASGVGERTIATMRARLKVLEREEREPSGMWWRDQREFTEDWDAPEVSEAEREKLAKATAAKLRKVAKWMSHNDPAMFADVLDRAFGKALREAIDRLYSRDEVDEWVGTHVEDGEDEEDLNVPF